MTEKRKSQTPPAVPWVTTLETVIPCYEGTPGGDDQIYAPPNEVLVVCVVADRAFLDFSKYEEDHNTRKTTSIQKIDIDAMALLNALIAQMGIERVQLAWPAFTR